ncbi:MAG: hypothetical protein ACR2PL_04300 [Dehalococcoidia bacterium]
MNQRRYKDEIEDLIEVPSPADVPDFASEEEEAEFWATHSLGEGWELEPGESAALPLPPVDSSRIDDAQHLSAPLD